MYKISWARASDKFHRVFVVVPDVHSLFDLYFVLTGYGRRDGCVPIDIQVTNLDGHAVDMTQGLAAAASAGTYSAKAY